MFWVKLLGLADFLAYSFILVIILTGDYPFEWLWRLVVLVGAAKIFMSWAG